MSIPISSGHGDDVDLAKERLVGSLITNKHKQAKCSGQTERPNRWMKLWTVRRLR